jgi:hypothetical protein
MSTPPKTESTPTHCHPSDPKLHLSYLAIFRFIPFLLTTAGIQKKSICGFFLEPAEAETT